MKSRWIITRAKIHMKASPVSAEDYLNKGISKANKPHVDDKVSELTDCFVWLNKHEHLNNLKRKEKA